MSLLYVVVLVVLIITIIIPIFGYSINDPELFFDNNKSMVECVPLLNCPEARIIFASENITAEDKEYLNIVKCGEGNRYPMIWCIIPRTNHSKGNSEKVIERERKCVSILDCPDVINIFKTRNLTNIDKASLLRNKCGQDIKYPKIWCLVPTNAENVRNNQPTDLLKTKMDDSKDCIPIRDCPEAITILKMKPISTIDQEYLLSLKCDDGTGHLKVWCTINTNDNEFLNVADANIITTDDEVKEECIPIKECPEAVSILRKKPITDEDKKYLKAIKCGDGIRFPKVWCKVTNSNTDSDNKTTEEPINVTDINLIRTNNDRQCVPLEQCLDTSILRITQKKQKTSTDIDYLYSIDCSDDDCSDEECDDGNGEMKVWCNNVSTVLTSTEQTINVTDTNFITVDNNRQCIPINECLDALIFIQKKFITPEDSIDYLSSINCSDCSGEKCNFASGQTKVWCNMINTQEVETVISEPSSNLTVTEIQCIPILDCPEARKILDRGKITEAGKAFLLSIKCSEGERQPSGVTYPNVWCTIFKPNIATDSEINRIEMPATLPNISKQECGNVDTGNKLIGGEETDPGEFPWMAILEYRQIESNILRQECGGTVINSKYVLSAAHCIMVNEKISGKLESILLGEYDTKNETDCIFNPHGPPDCSESPKRYIIESFVVHPLYAVALKSGEVKYDIGLIRVTDVIEFTDYISPICLPTPIEDINKLKAFTIAGWGLTDNKKSSDVLLKLRVPSFDYDECAQSLNVSLIDSQLCAGGVKGKNNCQGDSGGPLMFISDDNLWTQIGVISTGTKFCDIGKPSIYTNVQKHIFWVYTNVLS